MLRKTFLSYVLNIMLFAFRRVMLEVTRLELQFLVKLVVSDFYSRHQHVKFTSNIV